MKRFLDTVCCQRESFARFPGWIQPLITFICGKPIRGERPWVQIHPVGAVAIDLLKLVVGVGLCFACVKAGGFWYLAVPLCWILTVNATRSLTSDAHYAGHGCVTGRPTIDWLLGDVLSTLVLSANMTAYARGHNSRHHGREGIGTLEDPDIELLYLMGFRMGRSVGWYRFRLWLALISPRYHFLYAWGRVQSNFISAPFIRAALAWGVHGTALALVWYGGALSEWVIAWVIPVIPLVAVSAALQFPSEHLWLTPRKPKESAGAYLRRISHGRFFLVPAPRADRSAFAKIGAWSLWSLAMLVPLLERFFVCASVLPAHDYHHRKPRLANWPMEPYLRQEEIDAGAAEFHEFYGLSRAFAAQFVIWSQLHPDLIKERFTFLGLIEKALGCRFLLAPAQPRPEYDQERRNCLADGAR